MKITSTPLKINRIENNQYNLTNQTSTQNSEINNYELQKLSGSEIPFGAIYGIKQNKIDNIINEKIKLTRIIRSLQDEIKKLNIDEISSELYRSKVQEIKSKSANLLKEWFTKNPLGKKEDAVDAVMFKLKDYLRNITLWIQEEAPKIKEKRVAQDKNDYNLLNKLYTAVANDDMNLDNVYKKYYSDLNKLSTLTEVKHIYPKLEIPSSPEEEIAKKIVGTFDKNFVEDFFNKIEDIPSEEAVDILTNAIEEKIGLLSKDSNMDKDFLTKKLLTKTYLQFFIKPKVLEDTMDFSTFPTQAKPIKNIISQDEKKLLQIDYDAYVIDVLKQLYIDGKKLSEISYQEGDTVLKPKAFSNSKYKFEKPNEKIKDIIRKALKIKQSERNYEKFDTEQFQNRLRYYGNSDIAENEEILERLIDFDSSQFTPEDKEALIPFLRILDDISDDKISQSEGIKLINEQNLKAHGTNKLNQTEKEKFTQELIIERKRKAEFKNYCEQFDNAVDLLYKNKLEEAGTICSAFRPQDNNESKEISNKILQTIQKYAINGEITQSKKLDTEIKALSKYFELKLFDKNNPKLIAAENFTKKSYGFIDEVKAGQYIINKDIVENFPTSLGTFTPEYQGIVSTICQKYSNEEATAKLIKLNDYMLLPQNERLQITKILELFNISGENNDKTIIDTIVNDIYVKSPTVIKTTLNKDNSLFQDSEILPSAKEAIVKDKKFPLCLEYFEAFERSMTHAGQSKEDDGIQIIGSNNNALRKLYKQEVKISKDERLYSTNGDYKFDVYKPGLHKSKVTKA